MSKNRPYVADVVFDIDGVLADWVEGFSALANAVFGTPVVTTVEQPVWEGFAALGLSKADINSLWDKVDAADDWWTTLSPIVSLSEIVDMHTLHRSGARIIYLTNRSGPDNVVSQTRLWLSWFGFPQPENVIPTKNKAGFVSTELDTQMVIGCVEDAPRNIKAYTAEKLPVYVFDRLYNKDVCPDAPRVKSVAEFCERMHARVSTIF